MKKLICNNAHNCNIRDCSHGTPHGERVGCSSYTCRIDYKIRVDCIPIREFNIKLPEDLFEL